MHPIPLSPYAPVRIITVNLMPGDGTNEIRAEPPAGWYEELRYHASPLDDSRTSCDLL